MSVSFTWWATLRFFSFHRFTQTVGNSERILSSPETRAESTRLHLWVCASLTFCYVAECSFVVKTSPYSVSFLQEQCLDVDEWVNLFRTFLLPSNTVDWIRILPRGFHVSSACRLTFNLSFSRISSGSDAPKENFQSCNVANQAFKDMDKTLDTTLDMNSNVASR